MSKPGKTFRLAVLIIISPVILYILSLGPVFVMLNYGWMPALTPTIESYLQPSHTLAAFRPIQWVMEMYVDVWLRLSDAPECGC